MNVQNKILEVTDLCKEYPVKKGVLLQREIGRVRAVNHISFELYQGETLGIIGESGCGKTTLSRVLIGLEDATSGTASFMGKKISTHMPSELRKDIQMIFQDPYSSLDPRMSIRRILEEPLRIHTRMSAKEKLAVVESLLEQVGMSSEDLKKYPHEFSGGQRQRIGIARALVTNPKLLLCDEPVSALDVSIQAQILNLMKELQKDKGLTYMFVSHDMSVISHISDRILVMYLGQAVELADKEKLFREPKHPYTKALMRAVPVPDPREENQCQVLEGEIPSPIEAPKGCPFCTRCKEAGPRCRNVRPQLKEIAEGHMAACHLYANGGVG